mmetsp:Transcript_45444/g.144878  ORF Transcript_45444/g.144878 Transcript_45444/m.144878 type:complete len:214 (+) Transcript_45444:709-1350(+)
MLHDELLAGRQLQQLHRLDAPGRVGLLTSRATSSPAVGGGLQPKARSAFSVPVAHGDDIPILPTLTPEGADLEGQRGMHGFRKDLQATNLLQDLRHEQLARLVHPARRTVGDDDHHAHARGEGQRLRGNRGQGGHLPLDLWPQRATTSERVYPLQPRGREDGVIPIKDDARLLLRIMLAAFWALHTGRWAPCAGRIHRGARPPQSHHPHTLDA